MPLPDGKDVHPNAAPLAGTHERGHDKVTERRTPTMGHKDVGGTRVFPHAWEVSVAAASVLGGGLDDAPVDFPRGPVPAVMMLCKVDEPLDGDATAVHQGCVSLVPPAFAARCTVLFADFLGPVTLNLETFGVRAVIAKKCPAVTALCQVGCADVRMFTRCWRAV